MKLADTTEAAVWSAAFDDVDTGAGSEVVATVFHTRRIAVDTPAESWIGHGEMV
jgi:hypothetical protein